MADNGVWFKLWCAADDDGALDNLDICDYGRWCKFGTHTKRHGDAGVVKIISPARTLCTKMQVANFAELETTIVRFPHVTLVEKTVTNAIVTLICKWENWHKYQVDNSVERVRRFRQNVTTKKRREEMRGDERRGEEIKKIRAEPGTIGIVDLPFERFWEKYPNKEGGENAKAEAKAEWSKEVYLEADVQAEIMVAIALPDAKVSSAAIWLRNWRQKKPPGLDPGIKRVADRIYLSDRKKFGGLIRWIKQAQQQKYPDQVIALALVGFERYAASVTDWWPYLDTIINKVEKDVNAKEAAKQSEGHKREWDEIYAEAKLR